MPRKTRGGNSFALGKLNQQEGGRAGRDWASRLKFESHGKNTSHIGMRWFITTQKNPQQRDWVKSKIDRESEQLQQHEKGLTQKESGGGKKHMAKGGSQKPVGAVGLAINTKGIGRSHQLKPQETGNVQDGPQGTRNRGARGVGGGKKGV